jgi:hypothetical protein
MREAERMKRGQQDFGQKDCRIWMTEWRKSQNILGRRDDGKKIGIILDSRVAKYWTDGCTYITQITKRQKLKTADARNYRSS